MIEREAFAMNYSDLNNPSVVSGGGAFAEYILPTDNSMITTSIGTTVLIKDSRDGQNVWMTGTVTEMKSVSPLLQIVILCCTIGRVLMKLVRFYKV